MNNHYMQVVEQCKTCQGHVNPIDKCKDCEKCKKCCLCEGGFREKMSATVTTFPKFTNTEWLSTDEIPTDSEITDYTISYKKYIEVERGDESEIQSSFRKLLFNLQKLGYKPSKEVLDHTPRRLYSMYQELLSGYKQNPAQILSKSFSKGHNSIIAIRDIDFVSLCEHHWMPFKGVVHFGYLPKAGNVIGLSKIPRLIQCFSRRFQTQENMTQEIVNSFMQHVDPQGCIAISEAEHLCYQIRGPQSKGVTIVSEVRGEFEKNNDLKDEFLRMIGK